MIPRSAGPPPSSPYRWRAVEAAQPPARVTVQAPGYAAIGTTGERLLPNLLPNWIARAGMRRDEERFRTAKTQTIRQSLVWFGMRRDSRDRIRNCALSRRSRGWRTIICALPMYLSRA